MRNKISDHLKQFICLCQLPIIEVSTEYKDIISRMENVVSSMPTVEDKTSADELEDNIVHLHYFAGGMDWFISKKDIESEDGQIQAFGYVDLGFGGEWGYICIPELVDDDSVNLDLHFTPKTLKEALKDD